MNFKYLFYLQNNIILFKNERKIMLKCVDQEIINCDILVQYSYFSEWNFFLYNQHTIHF